MENLVNLFTSSIKYLSSFISDEENELLNDHRRHIVYNKCIDHSKNQDSDFYIATRNKCYDYSSTLYQLSFWNSISNGNYLPFLPLDDILKTIDTGTGALENMECVVIIVDGVAYGLEEDSNAVIIERNTLIPYISGFKLNPSLIFESFNALNYEDLMKKLDKIRISNNILYGFKITGHFDEVKVYKTKKTKAKLAVTLQTQMNVSIENTFGTAVGIWSTSFFESITKDGYHLHFINEDRTNGGHLMDFTNGTFRLEMQILTNIHLVLPTYESYLKSTINSDLMKGVS